MKKSALFIVIIVCLGLVFNNANAQKMKMPPAAGNQPAEVKKDETAKATKADTPKAAKADKKAKKPMKGYVASLNDVIMGGSGKITKDKAQELLNSCQPLVFVVGEGKKAKVYFVYNTDGSFATKKLSNYAQNKYIGIVGKTKTVNGVNWIIAETIEPLN